MQAWDAALFLALTGNMQSPGWMVALARFLATWIAPLAAAGLLTLWIWGAKALRPALLDAVAAGALGLTAVQIIGALAYRPRPFEIGLGANLIQHLPENSFPSDHATLLFSLSFGLLAAPALRPIGAVGIALALAVSGARVYLGAHYPGDILGGAILAAGCVVLLRRLQARAGIWRWIEAIYAAALVRLHLPPAIFPR